MLRLYMLPVFVWMLNDSVCKTDIYGTTTISTSVSSGKDLNHFLESTVVKNRKDFVETGLSTVTRSYTTGKRERSESKIVDDSIERRTDSLKEARFGSNQKITRNSTESNKEQDVTISVNISDGVVCQDQRNSCSGLCNSNNAKYYLRNCSCDTHCQIYKTCCEDFKQFCSDLWFEAQQSYGNLIDLNIECLKSYNKGYLVIASCPLDNQVHECDNSTFEQPISVGDLHFKNSDCLLCNGFNISDGLQWSVMVTLFAENVSSWQEGPDFLKNNNNDDALKWNPVEKIPKECSKNIIDSCPLNTPNYLASKCKQFNSYVKVFKNSHTFDVYGNIYCIQCNIGTNIPCKVISATDFNINKNSILSTLVTWTSTPEQKSHGVFDGSSRTKWKKMNCTGNFQEWSTLQCTVIECWNKLKPVNGICPRHYSAFCVLFVINWNHVYLNYDSDKGHSVIPSSIENFMKIYIQKLYITFNFTVRATNDSLRILVTGTVEDRVFLSVNQIRDNIVQVIGDGLSEQRFQGTFSFCIEAKRDIGKSCYHICHWYQNNTIPHKPTNENKMYASSVGKEDHVFTFISLFLTLFEVQLIF